MATTTTSNLYVSDTIIRNNTGASSGGIHVKPGTNVTGNASITRTLLEDNQFGVRVEDRGRHPVGAAETDADGSGRVRGRRDVLADDLDAGDRALRQLEPLGDGKGGGGRREQADEDRRRENPLQSRVSLRAGPRRPPARRRAPARG